MTDQSDELKATIQHLDELLEGADDVDPQARASLAAALDEIRDKLGAEPESETAESTESSEQETLIERLTEAARQFEDEHATLAGMIGSVIDTLGRMGI